MKDPRKLFIISYEYPYGNGETFLHNEIPFLAELFSEVIIIPSRKIWKNNYNDIESVNLPPNVSIHQGTYFLRYFKFLNFFKLLYFSAPHFSNFRSKKFFDIVKQSFKSVIMIGFFEYHNLIFSQAIYYAYWKNESAIAISYLKSIKQIQWAFCRAHRGDLYEGSSMGSFKPFDPFINTHINKVFCVSNHGKYYLLNKGFDDDKVKVSRLGVYPADICTLYSNSCFHILSVSHVVPVKRVDLIAKAILKLKMKVKWVHIGGGTEFEMLQDIVKSNKNKNIIIDLVGRKPHDFVYHYYKNNLVDLFLNVSSSEGLPVSIMEAYSFSVPCMACNVGGNQEIIDPNGGFLLSPKIDAIELSGALTDFYNKRDLWKDFRKQAFYIWETEYNAIRNYRNFSKNLLGEEC